MTMSSICPLNGGSFPRQGPAGMLTLMFGTSPYTTRSQRAAALSNVACRAGVVGVMNIRSMLYAGACPVAVNVIGATRNGAGIDATTLFVPEATDRLPSVATPSLPVVASAPTMGPGPTVCVNVTFAPGIG